MQPTNAIQQIIKLQRRLTGMRIMSYSRVLHSKAPPCLEIAMPCGGHPERAARLTSDLYQSAISLQFL